MNKLSEKQMQELLPDYVLGKITPEEKSDFESNLEKYPNIKIEVDEAGKVFNAFESFDFNDMMKQKSKNISVKVQQKRRKKADATNGFVFMSRVIFPSLAVLFLAYLTFFENIFETKSVSIPNEIEVVSKNLINDSDFDIIFEDVEGSDLSLNVSETAYEILDEEILENEMSFDFILSESIMEEDIVHITDYIDPNAILSKMNETELQVILRNIYNAKFGV